MKLNLQWIGCGRMGQRKIRTIVNHSDAEPLYIADLDSENVKSWKGAWV
jgi:predicted dinucleotide-utilizing enzyme